MSHMRVILAAILYVMLIINAASSFAQSNCNATSLTEFYDCYGGKNKFGQHSVDALTAFIGAEDAIKNGQYNQAKLIVDDIFKKYPKGNNVWWNIFSDVNGANIGTPHGYYGMRMMEDIIEYGLSADANVKAKKINMRVVMVGCSEGILPSTDEELKNGTGQLVKHTIDQSIKADNYRIISQSLDLFKNYVKAITKGQLELNVEFTELNDLCLPVKVTTTLPHLAYNGIGPVWDKLTPEIKDTTDWWMIMYPSHVPEFPDFDDNAFITGGMGADDKGGPVFIADDKWIVRKPAHLGKGNYSDIERRVYLPQWFQHEFFHHLYRIYPELKLEVNGHDWFNRSFWATDFEGQFETDYYAETLHKRIQKDCAPLSSRLITRKTDELEAQFKTFGMKELLGPYSLGVVENPWHEGSIIEEGGKYFWKNKANVKWEVIPDFTSGILLTGSDCPYPGQNFTIELYRNEDGSYLSGAVALKFQGDMYKKRFDLLREVLPIECCLGYHQRFPNKTDEHRGEITKSGGNFHWKNGKGIKWGLSPNTNDESMKHKADSPTPEEAFNLVLAETDCGINSLGFKYLDYYYWKPKRSATNQSPTLIAEMKDIELKEDFGNYNIDLTNAFNDAENDPLYLFVTSSNNPIVKANIIGKELALSSASKGSSTIYVMALDANGGLATDEFEVNVTPLVATDDGSSIFQNLRIFPSPTRDFVHVTGINTDCRISILSVNNTHLQSISVASEKVLIDLDQFSPGVYFLQFIDVKSGNHKVEKIVKY